MTMTESLLPALEGDDMGEQQWVHAPTAHHRNHRRIMDGKDC